MRSAVIFPEIQVGSPETMKAALLTWDEVHAIVPWAEFPIRYADSEMEEAWEMRDREE